MLTASRLLRQCMLLILNFSLSTNDLAIQIYLFAVSHKNTNKILIETVCSAMLKLLPRRQQKTTVYGYQVNCNLRFGDSLFSKIKQTIRSEDKQESKKSSSTTKKSATTRKKVYINLICIKQVFLYLFLNNKGKRFFSLCGT